MLLLTAYKTLRSCYLNRLNIQLTNQYKSVINVIFSTSIFRVSRVEVKHYCITCFWNPNLKRRRGEAVINWQLKLVLASIGWPMPPLNSVLVQKAKVQRYDTLSPYVYSILMKSNKNGKWLITHYYCSCQSFVKKPKGIYFNLGWINIGILHHHLVSDFWQFIVLIQILSLYNNYYYVRKENC